MSLMLTKDRVLARQRRRALDGADLMPWGRVRRSEEEGGGMSIAARFLFFRRVDWVESLWRLASVVFANGIADIAKGRAG
uniref:Uncharacterized protein n=1 Tax=Candidatus Kentrum sp. MB TaxID=2138164 RepID=A0A450XEE7_9GAMM|nr:MAG: hypothetical protein BECKMB1821G_GA0114241_100112 [Candidatus Kentron sp. MB]VFK27624.1 MAG: hypothetical protein BECKMB1821I_GA0114274_100412 [Candidatus Kentron sp. MB]VFK74364.1 MAG: hypothetical protein BECKMB1821H_GA0114242_100412 [Candidatus Kentron sp. MB]